MQIDPFDLERWLARFETDADVMLGESGVRPVDSSRFDTDPGELGYVIPTNGDPAFRAAVADRYDRGPEELLFTCGTQEANLLTFLSVLEEGRHAVVVTPTYQSLQSLPAMLADVSTVELQAPTWDLDPDRVAAAIRPETDLLVMVNPANPTGKVYDEATLRALYDLAADADAYLHCDEVYRELADDPAPRAASLGPRGISTSGLSKAWGLAGLRFGWVAGPPEVVSAAVNWKDYTTISPTVFGQHLARQALQREEELLGEHRALADRNRALVADFLDDHDLSWYEPAGVVGFSTVPDGFASGESFCKQAFTESGVLLVPGSVFGVPDRFRIGFGCETGELKEGLDRLDAMLERHG